MKRQEYKTAVVQDYCPCCKKCRIYVEGPMAGICIYGGPFNGYKMIDFNATSKDTK